MSTASEERPTILIVDDSPDSIALLSAMLKSEYRVKVAITGREALDVALGDRPPDLILLDVVMPEMDGYETCRRLKRNPASAGIPVIFLTAKADVSDEERGFDLGAEDYITKPPSPPIVRARIRTHLRLKASRDFLEDKNEYLEAEVRRRIEEVSAIQDTAMVAMGSLAETRDNETGNHIRRTQAYMGLLAEELKDHPRFAAHLTPAARVSLVKSAPLHDIGKVGIPDAILKKPGKLTDAEYAVMKTHTSIGRDAILRAENGRASTASFLATAMEIAWSHHENWDGSGYPRGLTGDAIPVSGRLMAVADAYDALISERVYKRAFSHEETAEIISKGCGERFDPDVVAAFVRAADGFRRIAAANRDQGRAEP